MFRLALAIAAALIASPALADPCEAPVSGYRPGAIVEGTIRYAATATASVSAAATTR
jgi:hypothetical protein